MSQKYICTVCDYIYDPKLGDPDSGISPGTAFEEIPDEIVFNEDNFLIHCSQTVNGNLLGACNNPSPSNFADFHISEPFTSSAYACPSFDAKNITPSLYAAE